MEDFGNASRKGEAWTLVYYSSECVLRSKTLLTTTYSGRNHNKRFVPRFPDKVGQIQTMLPGSNTNSVGNSLAGKISLV